MARQSARTRSAHYCWIVDNLLCLHFPLPESQMTPTDFSPIADTTRRAEIVACSNAPILTGQLEPGQKVNELRISEQMRVSRAPLREAMRELVQEGILTSIPYAGTFVIDVTAKDIEDAYSLNKVLDEFAIARTWPNCATSASSTSSTAATRQSSRRRVSSTPTQPDRESTATARADLRMGRQFGAARDLATAGQPAADVLRPAPACPERAGAIRGLA